MTVQSLVDTIKQYVMLLYDRQWNNRELLTIAAVATVLLIFMVAIRRRREKARFLRTNRIPKGRSIIGSRLGGDKKKRYVRQENVRRITKRLEKSDAEVEQLRLEIIERDQTEARFVREISVLTAANKQLQHEITELTVAAERLEHKGRLSDRFSEQKGAEPAAVNEPLRQEVLEGRYEVQKRVEDEVKAKQCRQCGRWKALSEFHKNSSTKDGLASQCKKCKSEMRFAHNRA
ncbi:MAG: hypothetical protein ACYSW0_03565 [Planctomycetota bacterium]